LVIVGGTDLINTLIFDLDGTLADTEKLHCRAYQEALAELGVTISEAEYEHHWIRRGRNIYEYVEAQRLDIDPDVVRVNKAAHFQRLAETSAEAMPGAHSALKCFAGRKRLALATSSYRDAAQAVLGRLELATFFEYIATKEQAERVKPAPDILLHVARTLDVEAAACLVIEDSEKGVRAAAAAGMASIAIPNRHTAEHDFSAASVILGSLGELTPEFLEYFEKNNITN
jgi:HAD superfamily hydrolase (TIGR01509 family)